MLYDIEYWHCDVLILVLVEIGLGVSLECLTSLLLGRGLNPCFSGNRFGRLMFPRNGSPSITCLNPCFSGNRFGSCSALS